MSQPKRRSRKSKLVPRSTEGGEPVIEEVIESEMEDEGPPIKIMNTRSLAAPQHKSSRPTGSIQFKVDIEVEEWIDDELFIEENFNKMQSELSQNLDKEITEEADWTNEEYGKIWAEAASDDSDNDKPLNEYEKIIKNQVDPSVLAGPSKDSAQSTKDVDLRKNTSKDSKLRSSRSKDSDVRPEKATNNDTTPGKTKDNKPEQSKTNDLKTEKSKNNDIRQQEPKVNDSMSSQKSNYLDKSDDLRPDLTKQNGPKIRSYAGIQKSKNPVTVTFVTKSKTISLLKSSYMNNETENPVIWKTESKEKRSLLKPIDPPQIRPTATPIEPSGSSQIKLVKSETVTDSISSPSNLSPLSSPPAYHPPKPIRQYQRTGLKSKTSPMISVNTLETSKPLTEAITSVEFLASGNTSVETLRSERISTADEDSEKTVYEKTFKWPKNTDDVDDASPKLKIDILYSDEPTSYHINLPDESNTVVPSTALKDKKKKRKSPKKVPVSEVRDFVKNLESKSTKKYTDVSNTKLVSLKQIIISEEAILTDSKLIANTSKDETDKILDIEVRNRMGSTRFVPIVMSREDALIEYGLRQWFDWLGTSCFRYSPLSYLCYICCIGWWHLHPFRLHIKKHIIVTIGLEKKNQECSIIAYHPKADRNVISVRGECWQCGNGYNHHVVNTYSCKGCSNSFYTCKALAEHTGICLNIWKEQMEKQKTKDIKAYKCKICPQIFFTEEVLHNHQSRSHVPRSDYPMGVVPSQCMFCNQNFVHYSFHYCSRRVQKFRCRHCSRHFPSIPALNAHTTVIKSDVPCRICKEVVAKECMMPRHLLAHNSNYVMVYKCLMCVGKNILLEDLTMVTRHAEFVHRAEKFTKTMWCYMQVPLPKTLYDLDRATTRHAITPVHRKLKESFLKHLLEEPSQIINNRIESRESSEERDFFIKDSLGDLNSKNSKEAQIIAETINVQDPLKADKFENSSKQDNVKNASESTELENASDLNNIQNFSEPNDSPEQEDPTLKIENAMENYFEEESPNIESKLLPKIIDKNLIKIEIEENAESTEVNPPDLTESDFLNIVKKEEPDDYEMDTTESLQVMDTSNSFDIETPKIGLDYDFTDQLLAHLSTRDEVDEEIKDNVHVCLNCDFEGTKKQFKAHLKRCAGVIAKKVNDLLCTKCDKNFTCMKDYVKHLPKHGFERCKCIECDREFPNVSSWSIHVDMHVRRTFTTVKMVTNDSKVFRCRFCKEFVERKCFFKHWEHHLELPQGKKVVAAPVGAEENGSLSLELISRIEELFATTKASEVPKNCIVCDRTFLRLNEKKRHLVEHLLDSASRRMLEHGGLVCHFCGMNLAKPDEFRQHMRDHAGLTMYHCELCSKTFSDSSNFVKHKKVHDVHAFTCDVCGNKFLSKTSLAAHIAAHRPDPIHCALCPSKQFYSESAYNKHVRTRHDAGLRGFRCAYCRMRFPSLRDKWDHLWSEHKVRSVIADCPVCGKQFRKTSDVRNHLYNDHKMKTVLAFAPVEESGSEQPS